MTLALQVSFPVLRPLFFYSTSSTYYIIVWSGVFTDFRGCLYIDGFAAACVGEPRESTRALLRLTSHCAPVIPWNHLTVHGSMWPGAARAAALCTHTREFAARGVSLQYRKNNFIVTKRHMPLFVGQILHLCLLFRITRNKLLLIILLYNTYLFCVICHFLQTQNEVCVRYISW